MPTATVKMPVVNSTQTTAKTTSKKTSTDVYSSTASNHVASKKADFDDSLKQASNKSDNSSRVKNDDTRYEKKDVKDDKANEVDEEVKEEVKERIKNLSNKDISEILANILNLLNNHINKNSEQSGDINDDLLDAILNKLNGVDSSNKDMNQLIEQLLDSMKNNDVSDALSTDSLNFIEQLLSKLGADLSEDNKLLDSDLKNNINNLISQISDMAADKQGDKVLGLEEMLNKSYTQDDQSLLNDQSDDIMGNADKSSANKEDDFLNKLLGQDDDTASAKINMFATRQSIQTQSAQSTESLSVNKLTFADDLIKDVKFMATNSIKELTVKVNPGNLGEITIKLIQEDGLMKANLKANSKETAALLAQNVEEIKSQLSNQDVKIAEVNIELYQEDTTFFSHEGFEGELSKQGNNSNSNGSINKVEGGLEDVVNEGTDAIDNSNVNFLA